MPTSKTRKARRPTIPQRHAIPHKTRREPEWLVLALAIAGMLLTGYLSYSVLSGAPAVFCAPGSSCEVIQHSRWSRVFGLPLPLWGLALYALLALNAWRLPARLQRWRRLWLVALVGLVVSLYLSLIGWLELDAFCAWCLLSLALLAAIFLRVALRRPATAPGRGWARWLGTSGLAALLVVGALQLYYSDLLEARADPQLLALANHLERRGVRFYGAFWCATCQEQKRLFGGAAKHLPYVECSPDGRRGLVARACIEAGITGYPTWIIRGRRFQQLLSPQELAGYSGFSWEQQQ